MIDVVKKSSPHRKIVKNENPDFALTGFVIALNSGGRWSFQFDS
jgi:hypothetical protein